VGEAKSVQKTGSLSTPSVNTLTSSKRVAKSRREINNNGYFRLA